MDCELVLENHYERIARDLDVYEIEEYIRDLERNDSLSKSEVDDILNRHKSNDDNPTRAKKLLDIFRNRLQSKIRNFMNQLKTPYPFLAQDFFSDLEKIKRIDELPTTKKHIRRVAALEQIVKHFRLNTTFVVIHGMSGTGKTNLAVEAAMHYALQKSVYWVNAGGSAGSQLKVLRSLLSRVQPKQEEPDSQSDPQQLLRKLNDLLTTDDLVILDNVSNEVDLKVFSSLRPKFLITTTDTAITECLDAPEKIDMSGGFTKEESLELISKVVKKKVESLPQCVQDVHKYFKGYPLAVTLIASQLAHCHENLWAQYCEFSDDGDKSARRRSSDGFRIPIDSTMQKCIQSLSPENQYYYKMLAIFKDNVFLTTETLQVLWNCVNDVQKVRNILNELEDKSMVIKNWKVALGTDVYEVHSTVLNYLRRQQSEKDIKEIHRNFVDNYVSLNGKIAAIPDDHYIYYYVIYHITSAEYLEKFKQELFSLDYIMAKLVACGPNDMAEDLKLYKDALEKVGFDRKRLEEISEFSERFGWDIYHTKVKDLQFFVQMPENSLLFKEAIERCKENKNLVLKSKWLTPRRIFKDYPFQSMVKKLYCLKHGILCEKWTNDKPTIVMVKLGDVKETMIADGSILCMCTANGNLLYKDKNSAFLKQVGGGRTPDGTRQLNGDRSFFRPASFGTKIPEFDNIIMAAFSQNGDKIMFASNAEKGIYDLTQSTLRLIPKSNEAPIPTPILCCFCSSPKAEIMIYATMDRRIYFYETSSLSLITNFVFPSNIIDMTPIPSLQKLLVLTQSSVQILSWVHGPQTSWSNSGTHLTLGTFRSKVIYEGTKKCLKSLATDRWIAIATNEGCLVKPNGLTDEEKFFDVGYGEVAALDIVDNTLTVITSSGRTCKDFGTGGEDIRRITVYDNLDLERHRHRQYLTDACQRWPIQKGYLLAMVEPGKVYFYNDKQNIFETEICQPLSVDMSQMGDIAVVGDSQGNVHHILPFKSLKLDKVTELQGAVSFLKINSTGKYIVAGCVDAFSPTVSIITSRMHVRTDNVRNPVTSRMLVRTDNVRYPIFDCFFEDDSITSKGSPHDKIILLFKNGVHAIYDCGTGKYSLGEDYDKDWTLTSAAYQNKMLLKAIDGNLHVINLDKKFHNSKKFEHRITCCCIEPLETKPETVKPESVLTHDSSKPWVAVALSTEDRRFQIVVCTKELNEIRRIYLDYAQEEIRQLVFSKSQMILMARCDWLCFWDVSGGTFGRSCAKSAAAAAGSTLHPVWKTSPEYLDEHKLVARFKLQLEVLSFLPSEDFSTFAVVHKKGDRRFLNFVDYDHPASLSRNGSFPSLQLTLKTKNGSL